jgi:pyruvate/2-oxoglutarate dehydrogenase complex dihydrolipoamide acyltransferase (E2) component
MAEPVRVPLAIPDALTCTLVRWLVPQGADVEAGEVVAEADVDEAIVDCQAPVAGVLLKRVVGDGQATRQGAVIGAVGAPAEVVSALDIMEWSGEEGWPGAPAAAESAKGEAPQRVAAPLAQASARVRNVARKLGVELEDVVGTGEGGAITRQDVIDARQRQGEAEGEG